MAYYINSKNSGRSRIRSSSQETTSSDLFDGLMGEVSTEARPKPVKAVPRSGPAKKGRLSYDSAAMAYAHQNR